MLAMNKNRLLGRIGNNLQETGEFLFDRKKRIHGQVIIVEIIPCHQLLVQIGSS